MKNSKGVETEERTNFHNHSSMDYPADRWHFSQSRSEKSGHFLRHGNIAFLYQDLNA